MTLLKILPAICIALTSCSAHEVEAVPGSITYGGAPKSRVQKAPIGSAVHNYVDYRGLRREETYIVQPDRSLKLVRREIVPD